MVDKYINTSLTQSLTANDDLKFQFATDGEGNYGYLGADDSFTPFKTGGNVIIPSVSGEGQYVQSGSYVQGSMSFKITNDNYKQVFWTAVAGTNTVYAYNASDTATRLYSGSYIPDDTEYILFSSYSRLTSWVGAWTLNASFTNITLTV